MDLTRRCIYISNSYYNKGLKLANERDMSEAAECLKKSLKFNKRNTDARNLLGLIYYDIGEVADALVQWVLSLNLQPSNNDADRYLDEVQRTPGLVESYTKAITDFNQILAQAQGGNDDFAIFQLSKLIGAHKNYLRPKLLLGLLYMAHQQNGKAYKLFQNVLKIDKGNKLALRCVDELRMSQQSSTKVKKENKKGKKDTEAEAVQVEYYRGSSLWQTAANIILGLIIGVAAIVFIYLPIREASISREYNQQVIEISKKLNTANNQLKEMELEKSSLQGDYDNLNDSSELIGDEFTAKLSSFQQLAGAIKAFDNNDIKTSAELFSNIDSDLIVDIEDGSSASVEHYYDQLKAYFDEIGYKELIKSGDELFNIASFDDAIKYYELSLGVKKNNPEAIYKQGLTYLKKDDVPKATELFTKVINDFPDSEFASKAKEERGY